MQEPKPPEETLGPPPVVDAPVLAPPATSPPSITQAHERLLRDTDLQFQFDRVEPPPPPPDLGWLNWLGDLLTFLGPVLQWLFWAAVAVALGAVLLFVVREILRTKFPERFGRKKKAEAPVEWRPEPEEARALLQDADALAAQGRYAEAAHLLLLRSVEDIEGRDARLLRPSLTSRDIAELAALPGAARTAFGRIAAVVEHSFFGGREVDANGWAECRRAYADFATPWGAPA